jgi:probable AcnD-accessory protein PrpF
MKQLRIPALYMRGGTSKGLFFRAEDLPADPVQRERILLRAIGSPDPYGTQIDGMGAATSSTSKVVLLSRSAEPGCDVDYRFGAVSIGSAVIDWSGTCGNLAAAVGPAAIHWGLVKAPPEGMATVRIWQANTGAKILAQVPMRDGEVVEDGRFELDGVAFPAAEIVLSFLDPGAGGEEAAGPGLFPSGRLVDRLEVPGVGVIEATLINAGNPAVFVDAAALGLRGDEMQREVNADAALLARCEAVRAHAAVAMGLAASEEEATRLRPATPKLAFVAPPRTYLAAGGKPVDAGTTDLCVRILSMGRLHHAMTGTGAVALAAAAAIPGTVVQRCAGPAGRTLRFGHPSGVMTAAAQAQQCDGAWVITEVSMSRSARRLMEGVVLVPAMAAA